MALFRFHLRGEGHLLMDRSGTSYADLGGAEKHAGALIEGLRRSLSAQGEDPQFWSLEVADDAGRTVLTVPLNGA